MPEDTVINFAFGSNLHPQRRESRAKLDIVACEPGKLSGYRLAFDLPGLPCVEPSMASVEPCAGSDVHGVLLTMSRPSFERLRRSEGGDRFYAVQSVRVERYAGGDVEALLFRSRDSVRCPERPPSKRYLDLIREGARASGLEPAYCDMLDALPHAQVGEAHRRFGALAMEGLMQLTRWRMQSQVFEYVQWLMRLEERVPARLSQSAQLLGMLPASLLGLAHHIADRLYSKDGA